VPVAAADLRELQTLNLEELVFQKAYDAHWAVGGMVLVEDVSLEVSALNGFPGPFVKWWGQTAGYAMAQRIAAMTGDDRVTARCGAACRATGSQCLYAEGVVTGRLVEARGESAFGFDPYFLPDGHDRTFAEMGMEEKNRVSHRFLAFSALREKMRAAGLMP
jgi:non-canonical purine NTP pyrophosphatase (RdgB/HAM1 family)